MPDLPPEIVQAISDLVDAVRSDALDPRGPCGEYDEERVALEALIGSLIASHEADIADIALKVAQLPTKQDLDHAMNTLVSALVLVGDGSRG